MRSFVFAAALAAVMSKSLRKDAVTGSCPLAVPSFCKVDTGCTSFSCQISDSGASFPASFKFEPCQSPMITDLTVDYGTSKTYRVETSSFFSLNIPVTVGALGSGSVYAVVQQEQISGKTYQFAAGFKACVATATGGKKCATAANVQLINATIDFSYIPCTNPNPAPHPVPPPKPAPVPPIGPSPNTPPTTSNPSTNPPPTSPTSNNPPTTQPTTYNPPPPPPPPTTVNPPPPPPPPTTNPPTTTGGTTGGGSSGGGSSAAVTRTRSIDPNGRRHTKL